MGGLRGPVLPIPGLANDTVCLLLFMAIPALLVIRIAGLAGDRPIKLG